MRATVTWGRTAGAGGAAETGVAAVADDWIAASTVRRCCSWSWARSLTVNDCISSHAAAADSTDTRAGSRSCPSGP